VKDGFLKLSALLRMNLDTCNLAKKHVTLICGAKQKEEMGKKKKISKKVWALIMKFTPPSLLSVIPLYSSPLP
jgi:hypothetical protein